MVFFSVPHNTFARIPATLCFVEEQLFARVTMLTVNIYVCSILAFGAPVTR